MKVLTRGFEIFLVVASIGYSILVTSRLVSAEKRASFLEGQMHVYNSFAVDGTEGTKYTK